MAGTLLLASTFRMPLSLLNYITGMLKVWYCSQYEWLVVTIASDLSHSNFTPPEVIYLKEGGWLPILANITTKDTALKVQI